ncbi:MAG: 5-formyltetrahydrofolate cyclo-ligase [Bacteroidaceae bacterium]|nr:5-formyltetrahydrofolate cyclo-ligase [Bacteroidaceae bacterium]
MEEKSHLRNYIRQQKGLYTQEQLASMSEAVVGSIIRDGQWRLATTMLLYYPLPDELDVRPLIKTAHQACHRVLLPVVVGEDLELRVYQGEESLRVGAYNIMEPVGPLFSAEEYWQIQIAIVPGMAFDSSGHRLGRGKGYYDRLLPQLTEAYKIGVCYPFQFLAEVPFDLYDVFMNDVICS